MKAINQSRTSRLVRAYVQELEMDTNAIMHGAIRKVIDSKNTDEKLRSLEFLLQTILKGQGQTDFIYNQDKY